MGCFDYGWLGLEKIAWSFKKLLWVIFYPKQDSQKKGIMEMIVGDLACSLLKVCQMPLLYSSNNTRMNIMSSFLPNEENDLWLIICEDGSRGWINHYIKNPILS